MPAYGESGKNLPEETIDNLIHMVLDLEEAS
jgi:hypothetical protein